MYRYELKFFRSGKARDVVTFSKNVAEQIIRYYLETVCRLRGRLYKKEFYKAMRFLNGTENGNYRDSFITIIVKKESF